MTKTMAVKLGITIVVALGIGTVHAAGISCPSGTSAARVSGKIANNAIAPGSTLGVAAVNIGNKTKLKCGVMGQGGVDATGAIQFVHTIVCDDQVPIIHPYTGATDNVHSQITLLTTGTASVAECVAGVPQAGSSGSFYETSVPVPGAGRGIFSNVTTGRLDITGTINCQFAIDMKFSGEMCL